MNIANDVLADLAGYAALESYGVVGMASPTLRDGVAQLLPAAKLRKGVQGRELETTASRSTCTWSSSMGPTSTEVSHNLANRVRYVLTDMADVRSRRSRSTCRASRCVRRK